MPLVADTVPYGKQEIRTGGLVANLYRPKGAGPFPAVLLLGGSGGGIGWQDWMADRLARRGFAALALAQFGMPGLPDQLERLPIEYIEHGLTFLRLQPFVNRERVAVAGVSKGAELGLLIASRHPQIRAVVAFAPSGVVWQSVAEGWPRTSSWSQGGRELPFVAYGKVEKMTATADLYRAGLGQAGDGLEAATIPVERINGPILLLSGREDNLWPSTQLGELIVARLKQRGFAHPVEHVIFPDAGHLISSIRDEDVSRRGGTEAGNRRAQAEAHAKMLAFLKQHLKAKR